ncbi:hypothetical protein ACFQY5_39320 [Paeniroseomonas aquatica]|uniref:hypothetical protein n=1 Tax=Paeniroseomonas aquatica TaxID=373043 RepID=UPI00361044B4
MVVLLGKLAQAELGSEQASAKGVPIASGSCPHPGSDSICISFRHLLMSFVLLLDG